MVSLSCAVTCALPARCCITCPSSCPSNSWPLVVSGAPAGADDGGGERVLKLLLADGLPVKQAARLAAAITGASKNALYERALQLKD